MTAGHNRPVPIRPTARRRLVAMSPEEAIPTQGPQENVMRTKTTIGLTAAFVMLAVCPTADAFGRRCRPTRCCVSAEATPCGAGNWLAVFYCDGGTWKQSGIF